MKRFQKLDKYTDEKFEKLLGGSKSKSSKSPAPASSNPYAAPNTAPHADPYAQPQQPYQSPSGYGGLGAPQQSRGRSASPQPPSYQGGAYGGSSGGYGASHEANSSRGYGGMNNGQSTYSSDQYRNEKSPVPAGGYGSNRYNNSGSYGQSSGYGSDPWGSTSSYDAPPSRGPGGYGGFGTGTSREAEEDDVGRNALFGGARQRQQQKARSEDAPAKQAEGPGGYGASGTRYNEPDSDRAALFGGSRQRVQQNSQSGLPPNDGQPGGGYDMTDGYMAGSGYGSYQDRQLTAEEQEDEDVRGTKDEIRRLKQQDVSSTRNALRVAEQAEATGRETLERLGLQGDMIHNTEKNLDLASNQNRLAEDKAKELKHLNRSMFAVKVNNPFTKARRERDMDDEVMNRHHDEKQQREATRRAAYESQMRQTDASKELRGPSGMVVKRGNLAERSKYQFEADSEDEAMEDEIDSNLDALSRGVGTLNVLGRAMGKEVESQNKRLDVVAGKADRVDDEIHMNRTRLDRIK